MRQTTLNGSNSRTLSITALLTLRLKNCQENVDSVKHHMKTSQVLLNRQLLIVVLFCVFMSACTPQILTPVTVPTMTPISNDFLSLGRSRFVFFARNNDLWRADLSGTNAQQLTEGEILNWEQGTDDERIEAARYRPPLVSPDGRWIVLSTTGLDLVLIDVQTRQSIPLPQPGAPVAAWSPDSQAFAYIPESNTPNRDLDIYEIPRGQVNRLLSFEAGEGNNTRDIVWSPDSRWIAFACCFKSAQTDVYIGQLVGRIQQIEVSSRKVEAVGEITSSVASSSRLCWTAEGKIALGQGIRCSYASPPPYTLSPDGKQIAALAPVSAEDVSWAGPSLLTVSQTATGKLVWQRRLSAASIQTVIWSPDGQYLLLDDDREHTPIWRIKADGTNEPEKIMEDGFLLDIVPQW